MMDPWLSKLEFELDALTYWRKYIKPDTDRTEQVHS